MITSIGFTGTRKGISRERLSHIWDFVNIFNGVPWRIEFHHGDCVGADEQTHEIVLPLASFDIYIHPPKDEKLRAFCKGAKEILPSKPYLERNDDIIKSSHLLIATPENVIAGTGGTWYTITAAREKGIPILFV